MIILLNYSNKLRSSFEITDNENICTVVLDIFVVVVLDIFVVVVLGIFVVVVVLVVVVVVV